ncbi:hypothetical protein M2284_005207 [Rhodococcus sp. LBL1]|nr:hypothetical protein [Rhodococcus sp. LBL1]MDH6686273.1 hypothetical protein [Rhodococcus sp. LBL2]
MTEQIRNLSMGLPSKSQVEEVIDVVRRRDPVDDAAVALSAMLTPRV